MPLESEQQRFDQLLWKKVVGMKHSRQAAYYYRKQFAETGVIPAALLLAEAGVFSGRRASGRKRAFTDEMEQAFLDLVRSSVKDPASVEFMTEPLRKVTVYRELLVKHYGEGQVPDLDAFYRLCRRHSLWRYIKKPDYEDAKKRVRYFFRPEQVMDLVQMDGCVFQTFEIRKDDSDKYATPQVIEIFDTGSRFMLAMDVYWSETNLAAIDVFNQWMTNHAFPTRTVGFRPDNAPGFSNLKRPLTELNRKYSLPGGFYFKADWARSYTATDKAHLESSHRALHNFEAMIIHYFKQAGKFAGSRPKDSFKGKRQRKITITKLDITLAELRESGVIQEYIHKHNTQVHRFAEGARMERWRPAEKYHEFMSALDDSQVFRVGKADIEAILRYGFPKVNVSLRPDGTLQLQGKRYVVVSGDIVNHVKAIRVMASVYQQKLFLFDTGAEGAYIGEAVLLPEFTDMAKVERKEQIQLHKNDFEIMVEFLKRQGMTVGETQKARLVEIFKDGLTLTQASEIVEANQDKYNSYRNNPGLNTQQVSLVLINLFFTHAAASLGGEERLRPYAVVVK